MLATLGVMRAVLVQPSVYGTDNEVLLRALVEVGEGGSTFRGVAVVEWDIDFASLKKMHAAGVRGVRVNIVDVKGGMISYLRWSGPQRRDHAAAPERPNAPSEFSRPDANHAGGSPVPRCSSPPGN